MSEQRGMSIPLKPCPFCGRAPKTSDRACSPDVSREWIWFISCNCDGWSAHAHQHGYTEEEAAERWNTRHGEAAK